jgi:hypothetical protein
MLHASSALPRQEIARGTNYSGGSVDCRADMGDMENRKSSCPYQECISWLSLWYGQGRQAQVGRRRETAAAYL